MKRLILSLLLAVQLVLGSVASAIIDSGDPRVSRLFGTNTDGNYFTCTVSYIQPWIPDGYLTWVLSAGHCFTIAYANLVPADRSASSTAWGKINWHVVLRSDPRFYEEYVDIAIGVVPDVRPEGQQKRFWLAESMPENGRVWIAGFPAGVERQVSGVIVPPEFDSRFGPSIKGTRKVLVEPDVLTGGSSGSPVLNEQGYIVGVLWGYTEDITEGGERVGVVLITPIEVVHRIFKELKRL